MDPAGWAWVWLLFGVGVIEVTLAHAHHPTLSQWLRRLSNRHRWVKWACLGALVFFAYHLFWQPMGHFWDEPPSPPPAAPTLNQPWCEDEEGYCDGQER